MTRERWQQVCDLLEQALELAPQQRPALLDRACGADRSLRQEVEVLLASSDHVRSSFLEGPPLAEPTSQTESTTKDVLTPGVKLGPYLIQSLIGTGGMGEVYRARDTDLKREVAIKVLPEFWSRDAERLQRFELEAQAAAALNHPNIISIHHVGQYDGSPYIVTELLQGESFRERLRRGPISLRKTIEYAVQIANGLAAAHEKGIVHRDLKPENLFLTKDGRVKILDFGLAKLGAPKDSSGQEPTVTQPTEPGTVMGTAGYMSPEQVRGGTADRRSDIFAFGAILYEMVTGKATFRKPTSAETMTAVLNEDPPSISQITPNTPPGLQRVVHRCLEKNPEQRFQSASDLAFALDALSETSGSAASVPKKEARRISKRWAVAAMLTALAAVVLVLRFRPLGAEQKHELVERQLTANPPENSISSQAISRDGKYLAYSDFLFKNLYLLAIDSGEIRQLPLTAPYQPVDWFPDGSHLLLTSRTGGDLWKMSTWDSSLRKLWDGNTPGGGAAVSPDGSHIAFGDNDKDIWLMGGDGEEPHKIVASDAQASAYVSIAWSPTGLRLAFIRSQGTFEKLEVTIETCDLSGGARTVVLSDPHLFSADGIFGIAWLPDGRIVYSTTSQGTGDMNLWTITADPTSGKPRGDATRLAGWKNFRALDPGASADGKRLIASRDHAESSIYIGDLGSNGFAPHRFTPDDWYNWASDWTKDSKAILFTSKRNGRWAIFKQNIDTKSPQTLIAGSESYLRPVLSAQGSLLYTASSISSPATYRLMSTPEHGGARSTLMTGRYTYACGSTPMSSCVVAELNDKKLSFSHLDPVKGKGEEIASIAEYHGIGPRFDLSPDGARIAIVDPEANKGEIRILTLADRSITMLPIRNWNWRWLEFVTWAADGKSLFAIAYSPSSVAILSVDAGGNPKVLQEMPTGAAAVSSILASPDGRSLAFTKRMYLHDVMLLENF